MNGGAGFGVGRPRHGLVHVHAVHAGSAVPRKQGGVNVDHPARESRDERWWDLEKEARQRDPVDVECGEAGRYRSVVQFRAAEVLGRDTVLRRPFKNPSGNAVASEPGYFDPGIGGEVRHKRFDVGA